MSSEIYIYYIIAHLGYAIIGVWKKKGREALRRKMFRMIKQ